MYESIAEIKAANKAAGLHWFDRDSMEFFDSIVYPEVFPSPSGAYFVSSEKFDNKAPRLFTVRFADPDGDLSTVGAFQGFGTLAEAQEEALKLSKATPVLFKAGDKVALSGFWFGEGVVKEVDYEQAACGGMMIYHVTVVDDEFWFCNEELTLIPENITKEAPEGA